MNAFVPPAPPRGAGAPLALRLALRELRAGLRGFFVFLACIALGVAAIAGVGSFARALTDGLGREGRTILGGDVAVSLIGREATADERAFLDSRGHVSVVATTRAMARTADGVSALVELKAVDDRYPGAGTVELDPAGDLKPALAKRDDVFGAAADPALLTRLGVPLGSRVSVGEAAIELRAALKREPDKLAGGVGFGPRLLVSDEALRASGLVQPGALVRWTYRLRFPAGEDADRAGARLVGDVQARFPDAGWDIRTRANASPQLERSVERFMQFLTLVGLTALLVGGVGIANAVRAYLDRKRDVIATLKALGAPGGRVVLIYLVQILLLAAVGTLIGVAIGAALPFAIGAFGRDLLPLPLAPSVYPGELGVGATYGLATALAFALWPLGRAHDVPVSALFRDVVAPERRWPRARYIAASCLAVAGLAGLAILFAYDRRITLIFVLSAAVVLAVLRLLAGVLMAAARRLPRPRSTVLRLALTNVYRPGALTPTVVVSLGLGLSLLVTVLLIDGNLRYQLGAALPDRAPSFFFLDIQRNDVPGFEAFVAREAPGARLERVPMLRGRIVSANGVPAAAITPTKDAAWALHGDRGITYAAAVPAGSRVVEGEWWKADYSGPPLVSLEQRIARGLGLKLGDTIVVNVLGRPITATVANLRAVDWETLGMNFVLVYSPNTFRGAPHTSIATLTYSGGGSEDKELTLLRDLARAFPAITAVRVKESLESLAAVVGKLVYAVQGASLVTILSAVLVLGGALAASHRGRVYDAVVLKTLGARRRTLLAAYGLEYLILGFATAAFGIAAGSLASWFLVSDVMHLRYVWLPTPALVAALGALLLTVFFGLAGTSAALGQKAAAVLRAR